DGRTHRDLFTEDRYEWLAVDQHPAERAVRLITHDEDRGSGPGEVMAEVVQDAAAVAHAGPRQDQTGPLDGVQGTGVVGLHQVGGAGHLAAARSVNRDPHPIPAPSRNRRPPSSPTR